MEEAVTSSEAAKRSEESGEGAGMGGAEDKNGVERDSGCSRAETGVVDSLPLP